MSSVFWQASCFARLLYAGFLLGTIFNPEDEDEM
jgi:hypothetical protein